MNIIISSELKDILSEIKNSSKVAKLLVDGVDEKYVKSNKFNYLDISHSDPYKISYITTDRIKKIKEEYDVEKLNELVWKKKRYLTRPGKIINKIFQNIDNSDIENFSNLYRGLIDDSNGIKIMVVNGTDMKPFYHESIYETSSGSLGASCMKHDHSQHLLELYTRNTNIKMILVFSEKYKNKIVGRALLWETHDGHKIMDRLYVVDPRYEVIFQKWAEKHNYYRKYANNWYDTIKYIDPKGKKIELQSYVQLKYYSDIYYPYLDTFKWLDSRNGKLYNYLPNYNDVFYKCLTSTSGDYHPPNYLLFDGIERVYRPANQLVWLNYAKIWVNRHDVIMSEVYKDYIYTKHAKLNIDYGVIFNDIDFKNDKQKILRHIIIKVKNMKLNGNLSMSKFRHYKEIVDELKNEMKKKVMS